MTANRTIEIEDVIEPVLRKNSMSLADHDPDIAEEWCYKKNEGCGPERFSYGSGIKVWWECPFCLRKYKAKINMRTANNSACPYCASKKVCTDNALTVFNPAVAAEWHPCRNGKVKVTDVTGASCKKAWWLCNAS
jgi:Probable Zinc-ribbon domain